MTPAHRFSPAGVRLCVSTVLGVIVGLALPGAWPWEARALLGWVTLCGATLLWLWPLLLRATPEQTRHLATREDNSRALAASLTTAAALVSLVGVGFALNQAGQQKGLPAFGLTALAVLTVAASWALVHTQYTLHYARRYYSDGGGVNFPEGEDGTLSDPDYRDFAYLSLTIGMTYQVSDTNLTSRAMRRLLLGHALLSYIFGTVIIAVTINGVAGLVG